MEKKQLIEIICIIAGVSLAIKAIDYMQYFISALFQLLGEQSYVQWHYFFIYLFTLTAFIGMAVFVTIIYVLYLFFARSILTAPKKQKS